MKTVSIIYVARQGYWEARHSFESIGFEIKEVETEFVNREAPKVYIKTVGNATVELFVIDHTGDARTSEYFNPIVTNLTAKPTNIIAELYNSAIKMATGDYICIIQTGVFLDKNWLIELLCYYDDIDNSGVVGIMNDVEGATISPLVAGDLERFITVAIPNSNCVSGVCMFDRALLQVVGGFDESAEIVGNEIEQYCLRLLAVGHHNYYAPSQTCLRLSEQNNADQEKLQTSLEEMKKRGSYFVSLDEMPNKRLKK